MEIVLTLPPSCDFWPAEREMKLNRLAQGKGLSRLWDVYLTGREGSEQRTLVCFVNHALMDGMSLALWLSEMQYLSNEMILRGGTVGFPEERPCLLVVLGSEQHVPVYSSAGGGDQVRDRRDGAIAAARLLRAPHQLVA